MKTTFRIRQPYADIFLGCVDEVQCIGTVRPERFIEKMKKNQGSIAAITGLGLDESGLERKNPVIVALGDSVTAGHFESLLPENPEEQKKAFGSGQPVEITDARESYIEKFRMKLIDYFEFTSVSVINAGIAGDHLLHMAARLNRDVIRYQPDLVLMNGSLNWSPELGTAEEYKACLKKMVNRIKAETEADIILLTPNGDLPNYLMLGSDAPAPTTEERVKKIREVALEESVCLADTYAVWERAREKGCPWKELLANGINHPSAEGHEVYARVLMKLIMN